MAINGLNPVSTGTKTEVKNLRSFSNGFVFDYTIMIVEGKNKTYKKCQLNVKGKCNVKDGDIVQINQILSFNWTRFRTNHGYFTMPVLIVDITNLTPPKIEW